MSIIKNEALHQASDKPENQHRPDPAPINQKQPPAELHQKFCGRLFSCLIWIPGAGHFLTIMRMACWIFSA